MRLTEYRIYLAAVTGLSLLFHLANAKMMIIGQGAGLGAIIFAMISVACGTGFTILAGVSAYRALHSFRGPLAALVGIILELVLLSGGDLASILRSSQGPFAAVAGAFLESLLALTGWNSAVLEGVAGAIILFCAAAVIIFGGSANSMADAEPGSLYRKIPKLSMLCILPALPVIFILLINL